MHAPCTNLAQRNSPIDIIQMENAGAGVCTVIWYKSSHKVMHWKDTALLGYTQVHPLPIVRHTIL